MDRVYGPTTCDICKKPASLGWLYSCRQDRYAQRKLITSKINNLYPTCTLDMADPEIRETLMCLADMGLSRSVIESATRGIYTPKQLDKLVLQKKKLQDILEKQEQLYLEQKQKQKQQQQPEKKSKKHKQELKSSASALSSAYSFSSSSWRSSSCERGHSDHCKQSSAASLLTNTGPTCNFQCCHACRPISRDRIYQSVDAVFADEVEPFHPSDIADLHIVDAKLLRGISLADSGLGNSTIVTSTNDMDKKVNSAEARNVIIASASNSEDSLPSVSGSKSSSGRGTRSGTGYSSGSSSELQVLEPIPIPTTPRASMDEVQVRRAVRKRVSKGSSSQKKELSSASLPASLLSRPSSNKKVHHEIKSMIRGSLKKRLSQLVNGSKISVSYRSSKNAEPDMVDSIITADMSKTARHSILMNSKKPGEGQIQNSNVSFLPSEIVNEAVKAVSKGGFANSKSNAGATARPSTVSSVKDRSSFNGTNITMTKDANGAKEESGAVEVMGGLALTEEAIEMSVPDVAVQV